MTSRATSSLLFDTERRSGPDDSLWRAIRTFPLDEPGTALTFSRRLARDHLWTEDYAARVVAEYRRFLYLMATGIGSVTPSGPVDEAWHLHLSHTRSYWEDLCGRIVGRPLHHEPTDGGPAEAARFRAAYDRTLLRYRIAFGTTPPADIWPDVRRRFAPTAGVRTVTLRDHWILRRLWPRWVGTVLYGVVGVGAFVGGGLAAAALFPGPASVAVAGSVAGAVVFHLAVGTLTGLSGGADAEIGSDGDGGGCSGCGSD